MARRTLVAALAAVTTLTLVPAAAVATAAPTPTAPRAAAAVPEPDKAAFAVGRGGAVSTVDAYATAVGRQVLRRGGNAVDAAVAAAATLGLTEPFSSGLGGGGFFLHYDARTHRVSTIDGRETAPRLMRRDSFLEPDGTPIPFFEAVTSGLSVGTPGTPQTWANALRRWGTWDLRRALAPAAHLARRGFVVDDTFHQQVADNAERFARFPATAAIYLPGGAPPAVGATIRNPDLAATYDLLARQGIRAFYRGPLARDVAAAAARPPVAAGTPPVRAGLLRYNDLRFYVAPLRRPTRVAFRGLDVYGMPPPSSGGSTVGEALNILENWRRPGGSPAQRVPALHRFLEASALAFADRNRYVGDSDYVRVPLRQLLSQGFADERACLISATAAPKPVAPGSPDGSYGPCPATAATATSAPDKGQATTHLTTADRWGNVVSYTLTIEQIGGSGITVPGRGFLLNNELTDFNFAPTQGSAPDPNLPAPGKRPRSSMSPTIVERGGRPWLALGSPGGSTIITTVLQTLLNRIDLGMTLPQAIAAPRASQRNTTTVTAEPAFIGRYGAALTARGHTFSPTTEIGAVEAVELLRGGVMLSAAEPVRRGGGAAAVVRPLR